MKNYFLIVLLLLTFNANALTGTMLMSEMTFAVDTAVSDHESDPHSHPKAGMNQSPSHTEMTKQVNSDCAGDVGCNVCAAHCTNALILIETVDFNIQNPSGFTWTLVSSKFASNSFRLLRPPKFS